MKGIRVSNRSRYACATLSKAECIRRKNLMEAPRGPTAKQPQREEAARRQLPAMGGEMVVLSEHLSSTSVVSRDC